MVPERFVGVWLRGSISINGGPAGEHEDVVWLQTPSTFADLRVPHRPDGSPVEAFSGTTHWNGTSLHWDHELDWHGAFADTDEGHITWDGDEMLERGSMTVRDAVGYRSTVTYEERWTKARSDGPVVALDGVSTGAIALHVRIGPWALTQCRGAARFGAQLARPDAPTVHVGDPQLARVEPGHPAWTWTERAGSSGAVASSLPVTGVETVSKQQNPRFSP